MYYSSKAAQRQIVDTQDDALSFILFALQILQRHNQGLRSWNCKSRITPVCFIFPVVLQFAELRHYFDNFYSSFWSWHCY